jgi:MYXO-CTERM domain-containing protein
MRATHSPHCRADAARARRSPLMILVGVILVALAASPRAAASPQNTLIPILDCVDVNTDGSVTAHFGYTNNWTNQVTVPAGKPSGGGENWFLPDPVDRGQPSHFSTGTFHDVFTVTFTSATLEWRLSDVNSAYDSVVASSSSTRCAPVPAAGVDSPLPVVLGAFGIGAIVALRRRRSAPRAVR